jgi:hypothetical protein
VTVDIGEREVTAGYRRELEREVTEGYRRELEREVKKGIGEREVTS